jgi:Zn-dependent M28 family amino/carboxypeptidase
MNLVGSRPASRPLHETISHILEAVSEPALRQVVESISFPRPTGTLANESVRRNLVETFTMMPAGRLGVTVDEAANVVVGDPGRARVLIGAHFDSLASTPGADDNASAVAALIVAAGAIGPRQGLCFVAFDGEELGFVGSRQFVERLGGRGPEHVHILEMLGYASHAPNSQRNPVPRIEAPTVGDFLGLVGSHASRGLLDHVVSTAACHAVPVQALYLPDVPLEAIAQVSHNLLRSDHVPFWRAGLPALMWTDTAEFRNPNYHQPTDTPDTLDYRFLTEVTRLLVHVALAGLGDPGEAGASE